jgi:hypothetical protein
MGGAVPAALKLHPDTRLSGGSAAQLITGLALDTSGYLGGQRRHRARFLQASPDQADRVITHLV